MAHCKCRGYNINIKARPACHGRKRSTTGTQGILRAKDINNAKKEKKNILDKFSSIVLLGYARTGFEI